MSGDTSLVRLIDHGPANSSRQRPARVILADVHGPVLGKDQPSPNLSLLYLAGYLQQHSPQVKLKYISQKPPAEYHLQSIETFQADIYAVSFTSYSASLAFKMIRQVKLHYPSIIVVIGGPHVMTHAEQAMRSSGADICVIGEGEVSFNQIVNSYRDLPQALPGIKGIAYISNGVFKRTGVRALIEDIDTIPFPARHLITQSDFAGTSYSKGRPNTEVIITRGCPLRCTFCANPVYRIEGGPLFRARSPESIAVEVEQLYQMGYREIYFHSDELNVRLGWSIELCKVLANLGHKDLYFQCNMRVVPMNKELAYWMKRANFWLVRVGIESANGRVLSGIRKRMSLAKTERACQLWSEQGIKVFAFLMMFNGWEQEGSLEHETVAEVRQTIRFVYRLWRKRYVNYASWTMAIPVPGAELYDLYVKFGIIDSNYLPDGDWKPYDHIDGLSRVEFNAVYKAALRQEAMMALVAGNIEWRNWRMIAKNAWVMLAGKGESPSAAIEGGNAEQKV